jgi:hypothetical protein
VTDVLVERGDRRVVRTVAKNAGARFSDNGFSKLVDRASGDDTLAENLGLRHDIPRDHFLKLLHTASARVRTKLMADSPSAAGAVKTAVAEATASISAEMRDRSREFAKPNAYPSAATIPINSKKAASTPQPSHRISTRRLPPSPCWDACPSIWWSAACSMRTPISC